jgi:hypothetical protein
MSAAINLWGIFAKHASGENDEKDFPLAAV